MPMQGRIRSKKRSHRRRFLLLGVMAISGCTSFFNRERADDVTTDPFLFDEDELIEYVGQLTDPWGLGMYRVESVALMNGLDGTGSDPPPGPQRTRLLNEMKTRQIEDAKDILAEENTSLVLVQGYMPPGIKKGERFDIFVQTPSRTKTESLRGGNLLPSRLQPMEVLGNGIRTGSVQALGRGALLVDEIFEPETPGSSNRGVILGGGVAQVTRPFGLVCQSDVASVEATTTISSAINRRFSTVDQNERRGVANPKDDELIELLLPHEYRFHLGRYIQVIRSIALNETPEQLTERLGELERELHDPFLSARAALRLEAIGDDAVPILLDGLTSRNTEIRFHAAEALGYMGRDEAAATLGEIAMHEEAFRWHAMTALASMNSIEASVKLSDLLHVDNIETRYSAFRALHARMPNDPSIRGRLLNDEFFYHVIASNARPFVHFSRSKRPEIVLFGHDQQLADNFLFVKRGVTIKSTGNGMVEINAFNAFDGDQKMECSTRLDDVIRTMIELGTDFEGVLELVRHAENSGTLQSQLAINAVPDPSKAYEPGAGSSEVAVGTSMESGFSGSPLPDLYANSANQARIEGEENDWNDERVDYESPRKKTFFGRMTGWWKGE